MRTSSTSSYPAQFGKGSAVRRRGPIARWKLTIVLLFAVVAVRSVAAADGFAALGMLALSLALLSLAGLLWGCDSRDGSDWKPASAPGPGRP